MARPEKAIRAEIERALGSRPEVLIMSNPSGRAEFSRLKDTPGSMIHGMPDTQVSQAPIDYGLGGRGGPDLIGLLYVRHEASGLAWAVALGVECKAPGGSRSPAQVRWHLKAQARGMWICEEATSAGQVTAWLNDKLQALRQAGIIPIPADPQVLARLRAYGAAGSP